MKKSYEINMCDGPILGKLIRFSVPLILSGNLQLLFNAADIAVVGRYTGSEALAAVGATGALNSLLINVFIGLSIGSSVVTAKYYGAKDTKNVSETVHTSILVSLISGLALIFIGMFLSKPLLLLMGTPENVIDQASLYMKIIFCGMPALMVYNFGAAVLRAVGDTKRPLFFLTIAGVINVILNLIFVIAFKMGVSGVALATIISHFVSALLVTYCLMKSEGAYKLYIKKLRIHKNKLFEIVRVGLPAGIQGAVFSVSNVLIQSSINSFGSVAVAGNTAAANVESFIYTSMNALYQASLSFTSQNIGAKKYNRIVPILIRSLLMVVFVGVAMGYSSYFFSGYILKIYSQDPVVISYGVDRLRIICLTYFLCGIMDVCCGSIRGMGYSVCPTVVSLIGACGLRIVWIYTVFAMNRTLEILYLSYPITWIITFAAHLTCFIIFLKQIKKKASPEAAAQHLAETEKV